MTAAVGPSAEEEEGTAREPWVGAAMGKESRGVVKPGVEGGAEAEVAVESTQTFRRRLNTWARRSAAG